MQLPDALLGPNSKNRKYSPPKKSFHFREYNFLALRLNNFLYFRKLNPALLGPSSKNKKNIHPEKNSLFISGSNKIPGNGNPGKKIPNISGNGNPKKASYILGNGTFQPKPENKKVHPKKTSYTLILKNFLYFLTRKLFLYFSKRTPWKISYVFSKKLLYFGKRKPRKKSLYFRIRNFLIFHKTKLSYISGGNFTSSKSKKNPIFKIFL